MVPVECFLPTWCWNYLDPLSPTSWITEHASRSVLQVTMAYPCLFPWSTVLKLETISQSPPRGLVKMQAGPQPQLLIQWVRGVAQVFAFVTSSQMMLTPLIQEPPFLLPINTCNLNVFRTSKVGNKQNVIKGGREVSQSGSKYNFLEQSWNINLLNIKAVVMTTFWMSQRLAVFSTDIIFANN